MRGQTCRSVDFRTHTLMVTCTRDEKAENGAPLTRSLLILGPHRSGTSAVTRVLNLLGVYLGSDLLEPKLDNRQGFWEHRSAFELNEHLLSIVGSAWHDYRWLPSGWRKLEEVGTVKRDLRSMLDREFGASPLWGIKDPRLCRLLPLWIELLDELRIEPHFVIVVRNPLEVARSLERRNGFSFNKCLLLYLADILAAIHHSEGRSRVFVSFVELLESWREVTARIAHELRLEWPSAPSACAREIDSFLTPSERHHRTTLDALRRTPSVPPWAVDIYAALEEASHGRRESLEPAFRSALEAFRSASDLFGPEVAASSAEIDRLTARIASLESRDPDIELRRLESRAERAERDLDNVQTHLTSILSSPLYRLTRPLHRAARRISRDSHRQGD